MALMRLQKQIIILTVTVFISLNLLAQKPNIVLIMLDDMGYSDLGCYGGEIQTPNIDRLAKEGIRFTQMHNCARCCPTRGSLMTGQYPQKAGITGMGVNLSMNTATIAEVLRANGYHTGMTGKWHLSTTKPLDDKEEHLRWLAHQSEHGTFSPLENYPCNRGFDEHWGTIWGVINYFDPFSLVHNEDPIKEVPDDFHMTDFITEKSIDLIDKFSRDEKPFFLYVAHNAPHWPLQALREDIAKYNNTYSNGWDELRQQRYERMIKMGLIDFETFKLPANSSGRKWEECEDKEFESACMSVHAAMIDQVDQGIGEIIEKLKETGRYENTLIFLLSDNGASYERGNKTGFDRAAFTRDSRPIVYNAQNPGDETTWNYIGNAWASAANTPFRFWKMESYEGGSATPFIIHWPAGIKSKKNEINRGLAHVIDVLPTCIDITGAKFPEMINGQAALKPVGTSLLPLINKELAEVHDTLYWEHQGGKAIRTNEWKMSAQANRKWELFKIKIDHTEMDDLSAKFPEIVDELDATWNRWAAANNVKIRDYVKKPVKK